MSSTAKRRVSNPFSTFRQGRDERNARCSTNRKSTRPIFEYTYTYDESSPEYDSSKQKVSTRFRTQRNRHCSPSRRTNDGYSYAVFNAPDHGGRTGSYWISARP